MRACTCILLFGSLGPFLARHSFYTWLVIQNRNPTRDMLLQWGIQVDDCCLLCNSHQESRDYLYFSYNFSIDLWGKVARTLQLTPHRSWQATLNQMTTLLSPLPQRLLSLLAWQSTLFWIWGEINVRLHFHIFRSTDQVFKLLDR